MSATPGMPETLETAFHFRRPFDQDAVLKRMSAALPIFTAHGAQPMKHTEAGWRDATRRMLGGASLQHAGFSQETADPLWAIGFMALSAPEAGSFALIMSVPFRPAAVWPWLLPLAEELADAMEVDFAPMTGQTVTPNGKVKGGNPLGPESAPGHPPAIIAPWMYLGKRRLEEDQLTPGLSKLSAAINRPTPKGGWVLQPTVEYSAEEPTDLLDAYAKTLNVARPRWLGI